MVQIYTNIFARPRMDTLVMPFSNAVESVLLQYLFRYHKTGATTHCDLSSDRNEYKNLYHKLQSNWRTC